MFEKYGYCSMIVDQHLKTVLIRELITRDFQRESLNLLYCMAGQLVISLVGLFSDVSLADGGHMYIECAFQRYCERCFTGTSNMHLLPETFNNESAPTPFDAACMFQNLNTNSDTSASISIYGYRMKSVANMFKEAHFKGKKLMITSHSRKYDDTFILHSEETTMFDSRCCFEHAVIDVPDSGFKLTFNNYNSYDLSK